MKRKNKKQNSTKQVDQFDTALDTKCASLRKLLAQNTGDDTEAKYQIAVEVRELRDTKTYGAGAFKKAAERLGCTASLLYTYDRVARCYPKKAAFAALVKQENEHGQPLSFSHVVELAKETDDKKREGLTAKALSESWSVAEIRRNLPKKEGRGRQPTLVGETKMGSAINRRLLRGAEFFKRDLSGEDAKALAEALKVYRSVMGWAELIVGRLSAKSGQVTAPASAADLVPAQTADKNGHRRSSSAES